MQIIILILLVSIGLTSICNFVSSDGVVSFDLLWHDDWNSEKFGNVCPNKRTKCTNRQTCCKTKHNSYHCCRYPHAVCCPDKFHCCPQGTTCDSKRKRCSRNIESFTLPIAPPKRSMEWPVVVETSESFNDQMCPNNRTKCKDSQTCCQTKHRSYHCCKYENAVCCSDKYHCCPEDSTCDLKRHRCVKSMSKLTESSLIILPLKSDTEEENSDQLRSPKIDDDITCPNNKTKCKDTKTCCITKRGNYYCCPHKNAVCCSDKYNCCPQGTTCDLKNKKCVNSSRTDEILWPKDKTEEDQSFQKFETEKDIKCPNNKTTCKDTKTCCITKHGNYYCCPHKNAVCCSDKYNCCPEGSTCDLKNKKCVSSAFTFHKNIQQTEVNEIPVRLTKENGQLPLIMTTKICPNYTSNCPGLKTCCPLTTGKYGCCRFNKGICCPDMATCCPQDTVCDVKNKKCIGDSKLLSPITLAKKLQFQLTRDVCPDNKTDCPSWQTCCRVPQYGYGCCPYENGVCCVGTYSCCPHGTKCNKDECL